MTARELADALRCGKPSCACKRGTRVHCANVIGHHNGDANPSLSLSEGGGRVLLHCHGGCSQGDVITALKERGLWGQEGIMPAPIRSARGGQLVKSYEFRNADGDLIAEHGRFEAAGQKSFAWRRPGLDWRDGLGTVSIHDLPLYRLADVLRDDSSPVWICEGEKAADACAAHGLLAVCLGGGAAQQSFGNTLDVLRDREVVLWPDNDEPGQALMGRLHALLPQSRAVRPVLPAKADAYDYFAAGGTIEGLAELLQESTPTVTVLGLESVSVEIPVAAGRITFGFTELMAGPRTVDAAMRIVVNVPGKRRTPYSTRLNLESSSAREGIRREIERVYPGKDLEWTSLLTEACDLAKETWRGIDYSVDLAEVALPEAREWAVEHVAPQGVVTIIFGMGGSGKSLVNADIALHCLYGMPWMGHVTTPVKAVMIIDYEDQESEWRLRVQQLCDGYCWPFPESGYRYMPGRAIPLADQLTQIKRLVEEWDIGLIVVDSAASACGGDLLDTKSVSRLINALTALNVTALIIAHNTKAGDSDFPYGNIFWHNLARATHYVESSQEEGSNVLEIAIHNRKGNRGKQRPTAARVIFDPNDNTGPTIVETLSAIPQSLLDSERSQKWMIARLLNEERKPMTVKDISAATGIPEPSARKCLNTNPAMFQSLERGVWALRSDREEDAS